MEPIVFVFKIQLITSDVVWPVLYVFIIQGVPLATEPGIYLIILPLMRILQQNLKWTYLIV
jgi:hypothetical protein